MAHNASKPSKKNAAAATAVRKLALAFPEAVEEHPWGENAFKVKKKVFLFMHANADGIGFSLKLPSSGAQALMLPFTEPTGYGLGKAGWVSARFGPDDEVPLALLKDWIQESYRAVAPKKLWVPTKPARPSTSTRTRKKP